MMKILASDVKALINQEMGEIWSDRTTRSILVLVPLVMSLFLPALFLALLLNVPLSQMNGVNQMLKLLPSQAAWMNRRQGMFYLVTNLICPMLFLMIPLMSSSISAAYGFTGEKKNGTMETLLLSPLGPRKIFKAKAFGCVGLSAVSTAVSFVLFSIVTSIGDAMLSMPFYFNWSWLVLLFLFSPGITLFGVVFIALISVKSKNYTESVQISGYLILPIVLLFLGQFTGLFRVGAALLLWLSLVLLAVDFFLWFLSAGLASSEKLLR